MHVKNLSNYRVFNELEIQHVVLKIESSKFCRVDFVCKLNCEMLLQGFEVISLGFNLDSNLKDSSLSFKLNQNKED